LIEAKADADEDGEAAAAAAVAVAGDKGVLPEPTLCFFLLVGLS